MQRVSFLQQLRASSPFAHECGGIHSQACGGVPDVLVLFVGLPDILVLQAGDLQFQINRPAAAGARCGALGLEGQLGGADQWGNITTGTELIRRTGQGEAFALTCPLITKADGGKFGKTEKGNIWLDAERTSPYQFYQFWLNVSDVEAERYIKIFTMLDKQTIESAIAAHKECPEKRELQKLLAKEVTVMVHGEKEYETAVKASQMLFGKATTEDLRALDEKTFLAVFDGVPTHAIDRSKLPLGILDALAVETDIFPSKGEARKMIQQNGFSLNKEKMNDIARNLTEEDIIDGKYILVQKGKKDYHIIIVNG